jgi:hypothetical protein
LTSVGELHAACMLIEVARCISEASRVCSAIASSSAPGQQRAQGLSRPPRLMQWMNTFEPVVVVARAIVIRNVATPERGQVYELWGGVLVSLLGRRCAQIQWRRTGRSAQQQKPKTVRNAPDPQTWHRRHVHRRTRVHPSSRSSRHPRTPRRQSVRQLLPSRSTSWIHSACRRAVQSVESAASAVSGVDTYSGRESGRCAPCSAKRDCIPYRNAVRGCTATRCPVGRVLQRCTDVVARVNERCCGGR